MTRVANPSGQKRVPSGYKDGGPNISSPGVYIGIVKKNDDNQNMGRLQVYIPAFGGDPEAETSWISVSYASPFAGTTSIFNQGSNVQEYEDTIKSYGFWAVPPDIDARVLVAFADGGRIDKGYWFACLFQQGTQVSIPGIPSKKTHTGENKPAAPKNKKDLDPDLEKYVEHKPMSNALQMQGLESDPLRGTTTSSATRESPSRVLGLLTPGQHQFVLDDGDKEGNNRLIRLRTSNGTQILLDDVAGHVYMITKTGESWVELSADGNIHIYGSQSVNVRSQQNINLYADNNINIEAGNAVNVKTSAGSIKLESGNEISTFATTSTMLTSIETSNINSGAGHYETAGVIHMNGPAAASHVLIDKNELTVNQGITESICSIVPEHEPWAGHSGMTNPVGHGNQQMQQDPAPEQTPRSPTENETPANILKEEVATEDLPAPVALEQVSTSAAASDKIKENNGFSPVNVQDAQGQSGGFGSSLTKPENLKAMLSAGASKVADTISNSAKSVAKAFDLKLPEGAPGSSFLSADIFKKFNQAVSDAASTASKFVSGNSGTSLGTPANNLSLSQIQGMLAKGINLDAANAMFANDIAANESSVKNTLAAAGVKDIPQNAFDGLVSMQNQLGDVSYTYVKGEKIDMTPLYAQGDWDRVAGFIAADDRDRPRRIQEAAMIAKNSYGPEVNMDAVVAKGIADAAELLAKGKLNKQTGAPATDQQAAALATAYLESTGNSLPGQTTATKLAAAKNLNSDELADAYKKQAGPWPY
jgi:hypothetical protein